MEICGLYRSTLLLRRTDAERVSCHPSISSTFIIWFSRAVGSDTQKENNDIVTIVFHTGIFLRVTLPDNSDPKQIADENKATVDAHEQDPSIHPDKLKNSLDIDIIRPETLQAAKSEP